MLMELFGADSMKSMVVGMEYFLKKSKALKDKYDWFVVVRNPYDRILSEYYCTWGGEGRRNNYTKDQFNTFLIEAIQVFG